jgi:hypothetical protein
MMAVSRDITVSGITNFPVQEVHHEDHMQAFFTEGKEDSSGI